MELQNEFTVPAPVSEVWKTLLDVQGIAPCIPGATVDRVEGDEVAGRVKVKVGPITASYAGTARFVTKDESAHRFVLEASGRETRGSGSASATVETTMSEQGSATQVTVRTTLEITGKQAQFGRGVMADVASKLTDQFAACLAQRVREPGTVTSIGTSAEAAAETTPHAEETAAMPRAAASQAPDALDLGSTVLIPVAKQLAPAAGGLAFGLLLGLLLGHRRQPPVVVVPTTRRTFARPGPAF
jgi:uncharacterized protein